MGKSGNPAKGVKKLNGAVSVWSNTADMPTGYGMQTRMLVDRLVRDGADVAMQSNFGLEGNVSTLKTPYGDIPHYPRGYDAYSNDVAPTHHAHFTAQHEGKPDLWLSLYDVWVLNNPKFDEMRIASWTPIDHMTVTPMVEKWLRKENVTPIAMSPHGVRAMNAKGIECEYVPHAVDTKVMKPTHDIKGTPIREYMGTEGAFVVGMNAANKASGLLHRKAFSENLLAFSIFQKKHPEAVLYLHTEPLGAGGGWNLIQLAQACGIPKDAIIFPPTVEYRYGIPHNEVAAFYTGMDVLLAPSFGEGFGVPTIEAQACGVRVIGSSWAASPDLICEEGWLVEGQPQWDASQGAFWQIPSVPSIVDALEQAYQAERGTNKKCIEFAAQFDVETVWDTYWMPVLKKLLK